MNSLLAVLSKLETNPKETLGFASCELLNGYLTGWKSASSSFICPDQDPSLRRFTSWLCSKHKVSTSLDSFAIVQLVAGNDHDAFFLYFEELCTFRELNQEYFESQYVNENGAPWDRATLIKSLGRKPPMYIGGKSILRLRGFLDGDAHARIETNPQLHLYADLKIFEKWLNKSHEYNALFRCEAVALVQCGGDTSSAFDWLIEKIELYESSKISTAGKGTTFDELSTCSTLTTTWPDSRPTAIRNRTGLALSGVLFVVLLSAALLWELLPLGRETRIQDTPNTDFRYAGMYTHQPSSGLELMPMRAYDPNPGRWIERDPEPAPKSK